MPGVLRVARLQRLGGRHEPLDELVVDAGLQVQARAGQADLSRVAEDRLHRPVDGVVELGVVEHDVGALAAELEAHRHEVAGRRRADDLARAGLAGERDAVDVGVARQGRSRGVGPVAVHDVQDARRHARLEGEAAHDRGGDGRVLGRLPHDGVAPRQRRHRPSTCRASAGSSTARWRRRRRPGRTARRRGGRSPSGTPRTATCARGRRRSARSTTTGRRRGGPGRWACPCRGCRPWPARRRARP